MNGCWEQLWKAFFHMRSNAMNKNSLIKREWMRKLKDKNEMQAAKKNVFSFASIPFSVPHTHAFK